MSTSYYKYHYRPGYGSSQMLIEFFQGVESVTFLEDLFATIDDIHPYFKEIIDLWQNDEVLYEVDSTLGSFILSKDIWGLAFIMAENNQIALVTIDELLESSPLFLKVPVDDSKYK